ncbi:MAG: hypothetical protein ACK5CA_15450 [Cyanobacteriota bacterium]|jgi:hypothetical protein
MTLTMPESVLPERQHPIPPPSHPRQFRAIGLVAGQYYPSSESLHRGVLVTAEGAMIEAALLGRMAALLKKHLDLGQSHLWVVYPRLRDSDEHLHFQLAGVWAPETLGAGYSDHPLAPPRLGPKIYQNQFSIRGELVFAAPERRMIVVKIRQSPRPGQKRPRFFKVKLQGELPNPTLGHFWDLQAVLKGSQLVLESAADLGPQKRKASKRPFSLKPVRRALGTSEPKSKPTKRTHSVFRDV